jgi:hypothetical protein
MEALGSLANFTRGMVMAPHFLQRHATDLRQPLPSAILKADKTKIAKVCQNVHSKTDRVLTVCGAFSQDLSYQKSWSWFLKPRAQAKEKKLLENFHAVRHSCCLLLYKP